MSTSITLGISIGAVDMQCVWLAGQVIVQVGKAGLYLKAVRARRVISEIRLNLARRIRLARVRRLFVRVVEMQLRTGHGQPDPRLPGHHCSLCISGTLGSRENRLREGDGTLGWLQLGVDMLTVHNRLSAGPNARGVSLAKVTP